MWPNEDFYVMDPDYRGFRASYPLKVSDLSGMSHDTRTSRPETENSLSSRSSEFQAALKEFSTMNLSKMEAREKETKNCADETVEKVVQRRPSLSELAPADLAMGVSTPAHRGRRKSLPSLGLVAVDIQYSIPPSKKNSRSYGCRENLGCDTGESELYRINEIFKTESNPVHSKRKVTKSLDSLRVGGSSNVLLRRRFSVGAQGIKVPNSNIAFSTKQRRASCSTCNEKDSTKWRVSIHQRSLNIDDDCDSYLYNPFLHRNLRNRRTSLLNINSNFAGQTGRSTILPKVGQRNSLVAKKLDEQ